MARSSSRLPTSMAARSLDAVGRRRLAFSRPATAAAASRSRTLRSASVSPAAASSGAQRLRHDVEEQHLHPGVDEVGGDGGAHDAGAEHGDLLEGQVGLAGGGGRHAASFGRLAPRHFRRPAARTRPAPVHCPGLIVQSTHRVKTIQASAKTVVFSARYSLGGWRRMSGSVLTTGTDHAPERYSHDALPRPPRRPRLLHQPAPPRLRERGAAPRRPGRGPGLRQGVRGGARRGPGAPPGRGAGGRPGGRRRQRRLPARPRRRAGGGGAGHHGGRPGAPSSRPASSATASGWWTSGAASPASRRCGASPTASRWSSAPT